MWVERRMELETLRRRVDNARIRGGTMPGGGQAEDLRRAKRREGGRSFLPKSADLHWRRRTKSTTQEKTTLWSQALGVGMKDAGRASRLNREGVTVSDGVKIVTLSRCCALSLG